MMVRQQWLDAGDTVEASNQAMIEDIAGAIQAKELQEEASRNRDAAAQRRVDVANEQYQQGSLQRRMDAEQTHGNAESQQFLKASQDRLAVLQGELATQQITMAEYQAALANINTGFQAGTQFANVLARASKHGAEGVGQATQSFEDLQAQLHAGTITQAQFSAGVRQLTADMQKATQAAQAAAGSLVSSV